MSVIGVEWHDNRGTDEVAFGFVYFTDGKRVAYTSSGGVTGSSGGWGILFPEHVEAATNYLKEKGIL